jgi:1-acyl-sn-glycerol-3-phosphate acyltransferase
MNYKIYKFLFTNLKNYIAALLIAIGHIFTFSSTVMLGQPILFYVFTKVIIVYKAAFLSLCPLLIISNHIILSLDILALFSLLILVLFQIFKEPEIILSSNL